MLLGKLQHADATCTMTLSWKIQRGLPNLPAAQAAPWLLGTPQASGRAGCCRRTAAHPAGTPLLLHTPARQPQAERLRQLAPATAAGLGCPQQLPAAAGWLTKAPGRAACPAHCAGCCLCQTRRCCLRLKTPVAASAVHQLLGQQPGPKPERPAAARPAGCPAGEAAVPRAAAATPAWEQKQGGRQGHEPLRPRVAGLCCRLCTSP